MILYSCYVVCHRAASTKFVTGKAEPSRKLRNAKQPKHFRLTLTAKASAPETAPAERKAPKMKTPPDPPPSIERHSRKCAICTHPNRQAIDEAFLHQSRSIVKDYNLPSLSSLYRHAHATGLWNLRPLQLRCGPGSPNRENEACTAEPNSNRRRRSLQLPLGIQQTTD